MNTVSVSRLWGRAWDLFKVNWLLLVGIFILYFIVSLIPFVGSLLAFIFMVPALTRAGFLVARQGKSSFGETFQDLGAILKVFVYNFVLAIVPVGLILVGYFLTNAQVDINSIGEKPSGPGLILMIVGSAIYLIINIFGWAGSYAILSGRAGIGGAIGQSFSLTGQNFGKVLLAILSTVGLVILGALPCGLGLLVVIPMSFVFLPLLYLGLTGESHTPTL